MSSQSRTMDTTITPSSAGAEADSSQVDKTEQKAHPKSWSRIHPVNIRLSIPFFKDRYYLTLVAGRERRSPDRLNQEKADHPLITRGNVFFLAVLGTLAGIGVWTIFQAISVVILQRLGVAVFG
ncbi:MAG: hypothetical protein R3245_11695, partial [Kiloniellales bacterium]|nr:hypothetical protein [Kiloniellales bacterium]